MLTTIADGSVVAAIVALVMAGFKFLEHIWPSKKAPLVINCPNKVETIGHDLALLAHISERLVELLNKVESDTRTLRRQHAAEDGVERWKMSPRVENLLEKTVEQQGRMLGQHDEMLRYLQLISERRLTPR